MVKNSVSPTVTCTNSLEPDQTPSYSASDLASNCLTLLGIIYSQKTRILSFFILFAGNTSRVDKAFGRTRNRVAKRKVLKHIVRHIFSGGPRALGVASPDS